MVRLVPDDRQRLRLIQEAGGSLHVVTARNGEKDPAASALVRWANNMCDRDYMRLERVKGDANNPIGERTYDFSLTKKGERAGR